MSDISFVLLMAGTFAGALVSSFSGFAFAPVAGVVMLGAFAPKLMIPVLMICSVIVQNINLAALRRRIVFDRRSDMLIGGLCAVPFSVGLLQRIDAKQFQLCFGLFLAAYAAAM